MTTYDHEFTVTISGGPRAPMRMAKSVTTTRDAATTRAALLAGYRERFPSRTFTVDHHSTREIRSSYPFPSFPPIPTD